MGRAGGGRRRPKPKRLKAADWDESKHPRAENGQFGEGSGSSGSDTAREAKRAAWDDLGDAPPQPAYFDEADLPPVGEGKVRVFHGTNSRAIGAIGFRGVRRDMGRNQNAINVVIGKPSEFGQVNVFSDLSPDRVRGVNREGWGEVVGDIAPGEIRGWLVTDRLPTNEHYARATHKAERNTVDLAVLQPLRAGKYPEGSATESVFLERVAEELDEYGRLLALAAKAECPQSGKSGESGKLRDSIRYAVEDKGTRDIALRLYAGSPERPEVVVRSSLFGRRGFGPRDPDKFLVFEKQDGTWVYTKHVGPAAANDWFGRAWETTADQRNAMARRIGALGKSMIKVTDVKRENAEHIDGYDPRKPDEIKATVIKGKAGGDWDEAKHPRDEGGQFAESPGGGEIKTLADADRAGKLAGWKNAQGWQSKIKKTPGGGRRTATVFHKGGQGPFKLQLTRRMPNDTIDDTVHLRDYASAGEALDKAERFLKSGEA